ncbi:MAG: NAD-dependent epimerase/dehydratase family protein, partial [Alphaproteobacteria bacterium]|nr:NAD-dependent epimerase/dehydratase family protein [Alphaproteobacteria bacterium]
GEETKTEASPLAPVSAYGWSKMMAEKIHQSWQEESEEHKLVICRPAVIFGHNEGGNFTRLAKLMKKGFFVYPGRKDTIKGCFYVKDLIDAFVFALNQPEKLVIFNGCYPDRYTIEQIVATFKKTFFPKVKEFLLPRWVLMLAATLLRPLSTVGIGIHPERVMKLVKSTDTVPGWLLAKGQAKRDALSAALKDWGKDSNGVFD